jgi:RNA polymerase sigma factor (sigma-70 family)
MRFPLNLFLPRIWACAKSFSKNKENQEDLVQEAIIKVIKATKDLPDTEDFSTKAWACQVQRIAQNSMIDEIRKQKRKSRKMICSEYEPGQLENMASAPSLQFTEIADQESVRELMRLLPDLERRILQELVNPSEDFRWFVRQKSLIKNVMFKCQYRSFHENHRNNIDVILFS